MNKQQCNNCVYCKDMLFHHVVLPHCCKYTPTHKGFPVVKLTWWCGEWESKKLTIKDNNL